ncbi:hypothetical protein [Nocardia brasiliensis]|uniref:hypothetical protein n=1 Tax=Nocardia brasiliensis TaxID=37326 RepID=UPI002458D300|nr:hypothetical protein [Nocardia brasiliensis]
MNVDDSLKLMRERLDEFAAQIPSYTRWDRHYSEPECPRWWYLNQTVTMAENGEVPMLEAWRRMVALLTAEDLNDVIWVKCARRNMWVAAVCGGTWEYGDPRPQLPALTLTVTFHPLRWCGETDVVEGPDSWVVADRKWGVLGKSLRRIAQHPDTYDLSFLANDPDAPDWVRARAWSGEFSITADLEVEYNDED